MVQSYSELLKSVKKAGLLERRSGFYIWLFVALMLLMAGTWLGFALIGDSWYQLLIAAALGIFCTQTELPGPRGRPQADFRIPPRQ